MSMNMVPVAVLSVSSTEEDIIELTSTVENELLPKIEKIDGVASVAITGQHIQEVEFVFNQEKLASLGLKEDDVKKLIQGSDMALSLGLYEFTDSEEAVSIDGDIKTVDQLKEVLIPVTPSAENPVPFVRLGGHCGNQTGGQSAVHLPDKRQGCHLHSNFQRPAGQYGPSRECRKRFDGERTEEHRRIGR